MGAIIDANIIIEIARGNKKVLEEVLKEDKQFYITSITKFEILVGFPKKEELFWINHLDCLPFDSKSSEVAAYLYKSLKKERKIINLKDLFIASIAISNNFKLITLDKDYKELEKYGLQLKLIEK